MSLLIRALISTSLVASLAFADDASDKALALNKEGTKLAEQGKHAEAIERFKAAGQREGLIVATYGHAGDGNLHSNVLYRNREDWPRVEAVLAEMMAVTVELGGTITGEHGVGLAKKRFLPLEQPEPLRELQRRLKVFLDPSVTMNPGKVWE